MLALLKQAVELNLFNFLDIQLAILLTKNENPLLLLIFSLLSVKTREGNVCLFIDEIKPIYLFKGRQIEIAFRLLEIAGSPDSDSIYAELKKCNAVCNTEKLIAKPLVLSGNKLYFQRMWSNEKLVANFFSRHLLENVDEQHLAAILSSFFSPSNTQDWQKIAIAIAVTSQISVISGGPGTGKTMIVTYLLIILIKLSKKKLIIQLAAPTGKAASRLTESLNNSLIKLNLSIIEQTFMPEQAQTIHRLLGAQQDNQFLYHNKDNPLLLDILIIDEASMIDLSMMAKLVEAIPSHARVIFLGDKDQLSSVEAGAVLGDLCRFSECGYSYERAVQLNKITGCDLSNFISNDGVKVKDRICLLRKSYRFNSKSKIGQFSTAINKSNIKQIEKLLAQKETNISFHSILLSKNYNKLLYDSAGYYHFYLDMIKKSQNYKEILITFNRFRLLTALRKGPYGVVGLNDKLEQILYSQGYIRSPVFNLKKNYEGQPIMITKNNHSLGLFNGDIGIILMDDQQSLKAHFILPNGKIKKIQPNHLPQHETAFVMTVHKSQGSEFEHTILVLPPTFSSIISKELIYTATTRAKKQLTIYANRHFFLKALTTPTGRYSGLADQLF
ncbi:MAG: exodeoxyribonuclease V subunit alpha [Arsenophonus sp. ET-DL12-MAG3]